MNVAASGRVVRALVAATVALGVVLAACGESESPPRVTAPRDGPAPGDTITDLSFTDLNGVAGSLFGSSSVTGAAPTAVVVAFTSATCPVATVQAPRLGELGDAYAAKRVRFIAVNPNLAEDATTVAAAAKSAGIAFTVVRDGEQKLANALGVARSTEVFLFDPSRRLRYRGALDDQYGVGSRKPQPVRRFLVEAIDAVLATREVAVAVTNPAGCLLSRRPAAAAAPSIPTYWRDVAPIIRQRCLDCHVPGEIGPMPLQTFEEVAGASRMIAEVVEQGRMPPWHADPRFGRFSNERVLTPTERKVLIDWAAADAPAGEGPASAPYCSSAPERRWKIGEPDLVLRASKQQVPATGTIEYRHALVPTGLTEDRWIAAAEVRAGNRSVVHHAIVAAFDPKTLAAGVDPQLGIEANHFASLVPGENPCEWPDGFGKLLAAGSSLLFEIHYTANGVATEDTTEIGLRFCKVPPRTAVHTRSITQLALAIQPGDAAATFESSWRAPRDIQILSFIPHMHLRGKSFRYELERADGTRETLLSVPRYDPNWQATYRCAVPIDVPVGSTIRATAVFDNSAANPNNPDPTKLVKWGPQTWDEMLSGYFDYVEK